MTREISFEQRVTIDCANTLIRCLMSLDVDKHYDTQTYVFVKFVEDAIKNRKIIVIEE